MRQEALSIIRDTRERIEYWFNRVKYYSDPDYLTKDQILKELEELDIRMKRLSRDLNRLDIYVQQKMEL